LKFYIFLNLYSLVKEVAKMYSKTMQKSRIEEKIKKLPRNPGVYIFYGASAKGGLGKVQILYVGKATSLRDRVRSYFPSMSFPRKPCLPAGRRESSNISFSGSRIKYGMTNLFDRPIGSAINQIADIKTIETDTVLEAFILEQDLIKRLQPKYNAMGKDDKSFTYAVITREEFPRVLLLRKTELEKVIVIASEAKQSRLKIINSRLPRRYAPRNDIKYIKIYGPYTSKKQIEIALKILRKIFPYHNKPQKTEKGCLDSQIGLCPGPYDGRISRADYLKNIRGIRMILEGKKKGLIKKLEKEMKEYSNLRQFEEAADLRNKIFALKHIRDVALITSNDNFQTPNLKSQIDSPSKIDQPMAEKFIIHNSKFRIEAYDISNISGQYAVGSMIVFDDKNGQFEPNKNEYRKFKIRTIQGADDVGMMREVLTRRFNNDWPEPNLVLLDGGKGHLHMAEKLLNDLKLNISLITVAKEENRKSIKYYVSSIMYNNKFEFLLSDKNLIKQIMDEAHRFAITYHKKIRKREFIR
jgi:excinuclease ABC subunit C